MSSNCHGTHDRRWLIIIINMQDKDLKLQNSAVLTAQSTHKVFIACQSRFFGYNKVLAKSSLTFLHDSVEENNQSQYCDH